MRWLIVLTLLVAVYFFRLHQALNKYYYLPNQSKIKITGYISTQPEQKATYQIITLDRFVIKTDRYTDYYYGQKIEVIGRLEKQAINRYLEKYTLNYPSIRLIENDFGLITKTNAVGYLFKIRGWIENRFERLLPEPQSGLLSGIVLGVKTNLPYDFLQKLRNTGTVHVVVASGYNLTVITGWLIALLVGWISRKKALAIAFLVMIIYTLMTGWQAPIVRAFIMVTLTYLAQFFGREKEIGLSLAIAATLMLILSPLILFDLGFLLSVLATAGIIYLVPLLPKKMPEIFKVTLAAQLGVLPILITNFGQISWLSPLINALVLPAVPLIMCLGVAVIFLGKIAALSAWLPLTYFVKIIEGFGNLNWISLSVGHISILWVILHYFVLIIWITENKRKLI